MWGTRVFACALALALALTAGAGSAAAFSAHGSVEQVYATGLPAGAKVALVNRAGRTVARGAADPLGGLLFRDVKPGVGYRLRLGRTRSDPLTVLSTRSAPPSTGVYDQSIPSKGYGYM